MKKLLAVSLITIGILAVTPAPALAGGNWLEFRLRGAAAGSDRARWDVFAAGETVVARSAYLSATFDPSDGPFHVWIERGERLRAGRPIPESAIRVGTFRMAPSGQAGTAPFTVPELPRGMYTLSVCDDPCRTVGFGESVQGWVTLMPTIAEARLVTRTRELRETAREHRYDLQHELRQARREARKLEARIGALTEELWDVRANLEGLGAAASRPPAAAPRPLVDAAAAAWLAAALAAVATVSLLRRRRGSMRIPDTPAELLGAASAPSERVLEDLDV